MTPFSTTRKIEFQHCDPAGIVFYPRYFELINSVVEQWFEDVVGLSFSELHLVRGLATPAVHIQVDFSAPSRLGDRLAFCLTVERIGRASLALRVDARDGDQRRLDARLVLACVDQASGRAQAWIPEARERIERLLATEGAANA